VATWPSARRSATDKQIETRAADESANAAGHKVAGSFALPLTDVSAPFALVYFLLSLLLDRDVAVDGFDDDGCAAMPDLTVEPLPDHLFLHLETECFVRRNVAG
jgi:hypothetical protein